jgi:flagellar biosynthesis/type III secretory pathway protein FliH
MISRLKKLWRRKPRHNLLAAPDNDTFTVVELNQAYRLGVEEGHKLGYAEGRADGISTAKRAATNQLKEIIWEQNKNKVRSPKP